MTVRIGDLERPRCTMLIAKPHRPYAKGLTVYHGDLTVGQIETSYFRERGTITLGEDSYLASRASFWGGTFTLSLGHEVLVTAKRRGLFSRRFDLSLGTRDVVLQPISWIRRNYEVMDGSESLGTITRKGLFRRESVVDLSDDLPIPIQLFLLWIVIALWRRAEQGS